MAKQRVPIADFIRKRPGIYLGHSTVYGYLTLCRELIEAVFPFARKGAVLTFAFYPQNTMCIRLSHFDTAHFPALLNQDEGSGSSAWGLQAIIALSADLNMTFNTADHKYALHGACGDYELEVTGNDDAVEDVVISATTDETIFGGFELRYAQINMFLQQIAYLNPAVTIITEDKTPDAFQRSIFHYPNGVVQLLHNYTDQGAPFYFGAVPAFAFEGEHEGYEIRVACHVCRADQSVIRTFANNLETRRGGTFLNSILDGMALAAKKQAWNEFHVLRLGRQSLAKQLILFAAIKGKNMKYRGPDSGQTGMPELHKPVKSMISTAFADYLADHPTVCNSLISVFSLRTDDA